MTIGFVHSFTLAKLVEITAYSFTVFYSLFVDPSHFKRP
jgi:hypothetical protein